jgi:hypothetical protein
MAFDFAGTIKAALNFMKLTPCCLVSVFLVSAFLGFASPQLLHRLGIFELANNYHQIIALVAMFTGTLIVVTVSGKALTATKLYYLSVSNSLNAKRKIVKRLKILTENEKRILRKCVKDGTRTTLQCRGNGVIEGLVADGIAKMAIGVAYDGCGFPYNITEFAWEHLNKNHRLIK